MSGIRYLLIAHASVRQNPALVVQLQGRTEDSERELRRSRLTRGDNRLPPDPVPALTPRGTPAQFSTQSQVPSGDQGQAQSGYQGQN